ncbi:MAG: mandelate racemase/muconate lactonizing enzyme family protein [Bacteroidota bacterium]
MMEVRRKFIKKAGLLGMGSSVALPFQSFSNPLEQSDIKIKDVKALAYQKGYEKALFVRIEASGGTIGWGECSPIGIKVIQTFVNSLLKKHLIGKDPFDTEKLWEEMFWTNHDLGAGGALTYAIAGVDCALWDIKGKILGVPLYKLIGGKFRDRVKAYGGFGIGGGSVSVDQAVKRAVKLAELGFKIVKIRAQIREKNLNPANDPSIKYYKAIRKELPDDVEVFLDPNEGYTGYRAIQVGKELQNLGMKYYESPCPNEDMSDTAKVVDAMDIPVMAGEKCYNRWMFRDLITEGNPDIINPDFIKSGGITEGLKICSLAQVFHKEVVPHNTKPMLGSAATIHILSAIPNCGPMVEYIEVDLYKNVCAVFDKGIEFVDGNMLLPEDSGLGMVINEKLAKKLFGY